MRTCSLWATASYLWILILGTEARVREGPRFTTEPPSRVEFLNSTGGRVSCQAQGRPTPLISWVRRDGTPAVDIPGLRRVEREPVSGLVFPPFPASRYRQDVHATVYRCVASNSIGTIVSHDIHVRAAVEVKYEPRVYDVYVPKGNIAVLRCHIPSTVKEHVYVTAWIRSDGLVLHSDIITTGGKYVVFPSGQLHVRHADMELDRKYRYACQTRHRISGQVVRSQVTGQLIVTEPKSNFAPRVMDHRNQVVVTESETALVPCVAEGYPAPTVRWMRADRNLPDVPVQQLGGTLFIKNANLSDAGRYVCLVNNTFGHEIVETELVVKVPLEVRVEPTLAEVAEGQSLTVNCTVRGHPTPRVGWYRGLRPVEPGPTAELLPRNILHLPSVTRQLTGMYQCVAANDWQSAQAALEVSTGDDPPVFMHTFTSQVLETGPSFVSLKCAARGTPLPQITWRLDGAPLREGPRLRVGDFVTAEGAVHSFVNISGLQPSDGGLYRCEAVNDAAKVEHAARIDVFGPPLVRPMSNISIVAGKTLRLRCPVSGYPIDAVIWTKGNIALPQNRRQVVFPNGTLVIPNVERSTDEGAYQCTANQGEMSSSNHAFVEVLVAPAINPFSFHTSLREGMRSVATCSVLEGDPPLTIRWYRDGRPLDTDIRVETHSFSSNLYIDKVYARHAGNYTCEVSNHAATAKHSAVMVVNVPPQWRKLPTDRSVIMGDTVAIDCQASGLPEPRTWWEKSAVSPPKMPRDYQTIISNSHIHTLENGSLMIREVDQADQGLYLCQAANGVGPGLSKVIQLSVHESAYFKLKSSSLTLKRGETALLQCEAFGEKPLTIVWNKDGETFSPSVDSRYALKDEEKASSKLSVLQVKPIDRRDSALFSCLASNQYGQDDSNIQLIVQEKPDNPTDVLATDIGSRTINLRWSPPYSGNSPILRYKVQYKMEVGSIGQWKEREVRGTDTTVRIEALRPVTNYAVRVSAQNELGWSSPSSEVHITTGEEAPEAPPSSVEATPISSSSIKVKWKPPEHSLQNGPIKHYYVGYKPRGSTEPYVYKTLDNGEETVVSGLRRSTSYGITVQAVNLKGSGPASSEVFVETLEIDPPEAPKLVILSTTATSVQLKWEPPDGDQILGYYLYGRRQSQDWEERQVPPSQNTYLYSDLLCGTTYHFHLLAFNRAGRGRPSSTVVARTHGTAPTAPSRDTLLTVNSSAIVVDLSRWEGRGCAIHYFEVQYRPRGGADWSLAARQAPGSPQGNRIVIPDLPSGTWHAVLVAAHSDAGPVEVEYEVATLTTSGGTVPPFPIHQEERRLYRSLGVVVPASCALIVLAVIAVVTCLVVRRRSRGDATAARECRMQEDTKSQDRLSMAMLDPRKHVTDSGSPLKDPMYFPSPYAMSQVPMYKHGSPTDFEGGLRRPLGRHDHIYDVPFLPKWEDDVYSHIVDATAVPIPTSTSKIYQTPRISMVESREHRYHHHHHHRHPSRFSFKSLNLNRDDGSDEEEDSDGGHVFRFPREYPMDNHEMSETECDQDFLNMEKKYHKIHRPSNSISGPLAT